MRQRRGKPVVWPAGRHLFAAALLGVFLLSGCGLWRRVMGGKKEKPLPPPRMLVFTFGCENEKIAEEITKGFVQSVDRKIEALDEKQFEILLASRAAAEVRAAALENAKAASSALSSGSVEMPGQDRSIPSGSADAASGREGGAAASQAMERMPPERMPPQGMPATPPPQAGEPRPPERMMPGTEPSAASGVPAATPSSFADLVKLKRDVFRSTETRMQLLHDLDVAYVVVGQAKEKALGELELGNLQTAENARMKVLDVKSGEIFSEGSFAQGMIEIVAPDRIGAKLASAANREFKTMRKAEKKRAKAMKKAMRIP